MKPLHVHLPKLGRAWALDKRGQGKGNQAWRRWNSNYQAAACPAPERSWWAERMDYASFSRVAQREFQARLRHQYRLLSDEAVN